MTRYLWTSDSAVVSNHFSGYVDTAAIHQNIEDSIIAVSQRGGSNAVLLQIVKVDYGGPSGFEL